MHQVAVGHVDRDVETIRQLLLLERQFALEQQQLSDRLDVSVNVANGNLVHAANDLQITGTGLDLGVSRFFNNRGNQPETRGGGAGWQLSGGMGVRLFREGNGDQLYIG